MPTHRRCARCKRKKLLTRYPTPLARMCSSCWNKHRCLVCNEPITDDCRRRTCSKKCAQAHKAASLAAASAARSARPTPKTRVCPACNERKPLDAEHFPRSKTGGWGFGHWCRPCKNAYLRDRYNTTPEWQENSRRRAKERRLREQARRAADPEYDEKVRLQRQAEWRRARDRQRERRSAVTGPGNWEGTEMPAAPLAEAIERIAERRNLSLEELCASIGIWARTVFRWREEPGCKVRETRADDILTKLGLLWWDVWEPEEYPEVAERWAA